MNNSTLRTSIEELNGLTNEQYVVNSFDMGDSTKTKYGLVKLNKDKTMDLVLEAKYNKREIYYHIQGYLIFSKQTISTQVIPKETNKPKGKKK